MIQILFACVLLAVGTAAAALAQLDALPHGDTARGNYFGVSVSLDSTRALVGASGEHSCAANAGAAYVYEYDDVTDRWRETARLVPDDCEENLFFGRQVALSGDRVLIAADTEYFAAVRTNAAYVFDRDSTGRWLETTRLTANAPTEEGPLGASVSLEDDRALVTTWGDVANGRYGGAAYVFDYDPASKRWTRTARLSGSLQYGIFGADAALSGDRLVVASSSYFRRGAGYFYVFERSMAGNWQQVARFGGIDDFFISLDIDGDRILVGESKERRSNIGTATLYTRDSTGTWEHTGALQPPVPYKQGGFGSEVSLSGDRALVTGYDEQLRLDINVDRVVYIYSYDAERAKWAYRSIVDIGSVAFGAALDLDNNVALIGSASEREAGAAYIVRLH